MVDLRQLIAIDVFSGVGGLSLGLHRAGFKVVGGFDVDPINVQTYAKNFPESAAICADVAKLTGGEARRLVGLGTDDEIDLVCGGPPCQGFSLIGKRRTDDPRNQLILEFARLIAELQPRYFVIENVAGLMAGQARSFLAQALTVLRRKGYKWVTPIRILDAKDYGVPQTRKRVIVMGYRSGEAPPSYPARTRGNVTVRQAIQDLYSLGRRKSLLRTDKFHGRLGSPSSYSRKLRVGQRVSVVLTGCQLCSHDSKVVARFRATSPGTSEPVSRFYRLHLGRLAPTLRAGTGKEKGSFTAARPIHPTQPRCITVREAARLHSFPDMFEFHGTQWHGFRQVGNSVPPLMALALATEIRRAIHDAEDESPRSHGKD
jgi:DNA (cytosine-5)-methyltransferase 1